MEKENIYLWKKRTKCEPVIVSEHALISNTTPFGDSASVVLTIVIWTRETGVFDGIWAELRLAGLVLSSIGLEFDKTGSSFIFLLSGE